MIVEKIKDGYMIIMADSDTAEVVIKMKEEAAIKLRNRLNKLLPTVIDDDKIQEILQDGE